MLFKKKEKKGIPTSEVREMTMKGKNEREIVQKLKKEGYDIDQIEKAMMSAVRNGVSEESPSSNMSGGLERMEDKPFSLQDVYGAEHIEEHREPLFSQDNIPDELMEPEYSEPQEEPDVLIEELVEGIVEDKWKRFQDDNDKVRDNIGDLKAEIKALKLKSDEKGNIPRDTEEEDMKDLNAKIEDLEIRISGLEKAFRQFLPSLTRNIESLSDMVHEVKEKKYEKYS